MTRLDAAGLTHLQLWDAHADVVIFALNRAVWLALSDADRDIVRATAQDAAKSAAKLREEQSGAVALGELGRRRIAVTPPDCGRQDWISRRDACGLRQVGVGRRRRAGERC